VTAETGTWKRRRQDGVASGDDDMNFKTVNGSVSIYVPARFDGSFRLTLSTAEST